MQLALALPPLQKPEMKMIKLQTQYTPGVRLMPGVTKDCVRLDGVDGLQRGGGAARRGHCPALRGGDAVERHQQPLQPPRALAPAPGAMPGEWGEPTNLRG